MRRALLTLLVLGNITGCVKHQPTGLHIGESATTEDNRPRWDGWMVVDPSTNQIAFLGWDGNGDVIQFEPSIVVKGDSDGQGGYVFTPPYRSPFFQHITLQGQMVLGYYDITPFCWLGVSANWYQMQASETSLVMVAGVTGNIYHVAIGEGMKIVDAIGECSNFVTPNTALQ